MWADIDTKQDFLNYGEAAALVAEVVENKRMLPTSIGVFGSWGTGKSTLLNIIEHEIRGNKATEDAIVVRFDAWLYQGYDDAKAALMEVISTALIAEADKLDDSDLERRGLSLLKRVRWFRLGGLAAEAGGALLGLPLLGAGRAAAAGLEKIFEGDATEDDIKKVADGAKDIKEKAKGLIDPKKERTPPQMIDEFRSEFGKLLGELGRTLVVFIDNLDRCMPEQTIRTLEAMRLFLFMDKTAFVVAADEEMVRSSVKAHFSDIGEKHVNDYLDKLIQVPLRVPRLGVREVRAYLFQLLADAADLPAEKQSALRTALGDNMQAAWRDDPTAVDEVLRILGLPGDSDDGRAFYTADRISYLLAAPPVSGNPRLIKRMLNVVRMRSRTARRRKMPASEDLIAKVALFERCMGDDATKQFYAMIQGAKEGKVERFAELEAVAGKDGFANHLPEHWRQSASILEQWFQLEPKVSGDLRPIAYLGRETAALTVQRSTLSEAGRTALETLLIAASQSGTAAKNALKKVAPAELPAIMEAIAGELQKEVDWSSVPKGWSGALILLEHAPSTLNILRRVVAERAGDKPPAWLIAASRTRNLLAAGGA